MMPFVGRYAETPSPTNCRYGTIEAFNSSFGAGQPLAADPRRIRRITGGHAQHTETSSCASFISASSSFLEQDLSDFDEEHGMHVTMNTSASGIAMSSTPSRPVTQVW
jgi:hypothetical protein